ncbi:MAG: CaiB/BaiF CoA transferase family protein [Jhaorihella sp.]
MTGALSDIRVLDLTQMLAGPFCTMLLADQGAEVIKVEPVTGDPTRDFGPHVEGSQHYGGYFQSTNRNKLSLALDLKSALGRDIFVDLVRGADVVVENFRPGVMERLGLAYETLAQANPRLVYAAIRGFGDPRTGESPYQSWPSYDVVAQATGGFISINGTETAELHKAGPGIGDIAPALFAAFGIVSALHETRRSGQGQFLDVAMMDAVLSLTERIVYQHSYTGEIPGPEGNLHPLLSPFGVFAASDGQITIACPKDHFWRDLTELMGHPELGQHPDYARNEDRLRNREQVREIIERWTRVRSKKEIAGLLGGRVPFGPVNHAGDLAEDAHVRARDMLWHVPHPGIDRRVAIAGTPVKFARTPAPDPRRAPVLGEHSEAVLSSANISPERREEARRTGVTLCAGD